MQKPSPDLYFQKPPRPTADLPPNDRTYSIKKMKEIHHEISRQVAMGIPDVQIAEGLDVTPAMVRYTKNSPIVKRKIELLRGAADAETIEVMREIQQLAPYAIRTLEDIMLHPNSDDKLKAQIARDVLDRAGHSAPKDIRMLHGHITGDELAEVKRRAKAAGHLPDVSIEDASFEEIKDDQSDG